jgi:hypothetical protein
MTYAIIGIATLAGWALGMYHASTICSKNGVGLMETHNTPSKLKSPGSDAILRANAASCFGCAWHIRLWIQPWKWGRLAAPRSGERKSEAG